jgi:hypothetical protein
MLKWHQVLPAQKGTAFAMANPSYKAVKVAMFFSKKQIQSGSSVLFNLVTVFLTGGCA